MDGASFKMASRDTGVQGNGSKWGGRHVTRGCTRCGLKWGVRMLEELKLPGKKQSNRSNLRFKA